MNDKGQGVFAIFLIVTVLFLFLIFGNVVLEGINDKNIVTSMANSLAKEGFEVTCHKNGMTTDDYTCFYKNEYPNMHPSFEIYSHSFYKYEGKWCKEYTTICEGDI